MITVTISINGHPIYARTAVNKAQQKGDETLYKVDTGQRIWHNPRRGAVVLAKKLLNTIKEP